MTEEERPKKQTGPQFIPKLRGKKFIIRLIYDTLILLAKAKIGIKNFGAKRILHPIKYYRNQEQNTFNS